MSRDLRFGRRLSAEDNYSSPLRRSGSRELAAKEASKQRLTPTEARDRALLGNHALFLKGLGVEFDAENLAAIQLVFSIAVKGLPALSRNPLHELSAAVLGHCLSYLSVTEHVTVAVACRSFNEAARSPQAWQKPVRIGNVGLKMKQSLHKLEQYNFASIALQVDRWDNSLTKLAPKLHSLEMATAFHHAHELDRSFNQLTRLVAPVKRLPVDLFQAVRTLDIRQLVHGSDPNNLEFIPKLRSLTDLSVCAVRDERLLGKLAASMPKLKSLRITLLSGLSKSSEILGFELAPRVLSLRITNATGATALTAPLRALSACRSLGVVALELAQNSGLIQGHAEVLAALNLQRLDLDVGFLSGAVIRGLGAASSIQLMRITVHDGIYMTRESVAALSCLRQQQLWLDVRVATRGSSSGWGEMTPKRLQAEVSAAAKLLPLCTLRCDLRLAEDSSAAGRTQQCLVMELSST